MKKKLVSYMLVVCMLLSMLPTTAWAEDVATSSDVEPLAETPVNLDIANGSIVIDGDGYTQAPATEETAYTGDYVISGTTNANTLTVSGGTEESPLKITFIDASMRKFTIGSNSYVELTLQGSNSVTPAAVEGVTYAERDTAIVLPADSTLVLAGDGDFTVTGGGYGYKPIADGTSKGGTVIQNMTGKMSWLATAKGNGGAPVLTKYVLNSGTFYGTMTKSAFSADYFEKNGGTNTAKANYFDKVANITITQGLYDGKLAPKGDAGIAASARYQLLIGDNRAYWKSSPVTVSYGESNYTYNTDENGNIDFFAPATANTISVKVNETTYTLSKAVYGNQTEVKYVGPECTCDTDPGTFILTEETVSAADGVYIYTPTAPKTISLKGVYTPKDACRSPYHTNYLTPTWEITAITKNGAPVGASNYVDYAELNSATGVLTLKYADADYTVSVKGTVGTTNKVSTETLAVAARIYKATTDNILDVADGNITVTAGTDENEGKVVYTQGSTSFAVALDEKVTIAGAAAANSGNIIKVDNCSPSFILHNVIVTPAANFVSPILISGDSHAKIYISGTNELVKHISGKVSNDNTTRTYCGIQLLSADAEKPAKVTIDCIEGADCTDKNCPHKLYVYTDLGAGIGSHGWYNKNTGYSEIFEVNIDGGHIIAHPGNFGTGIGSGWNSTAKFTVNINDGFVEADGGHFAALIGYGRNADSENVEVNISGGIVEATSANSDGYLDTVQAALQAGVINISGTDTVVDVIGGIRATQATFISDEAEVSVAEKSKPEGVVTGNPGFVSGTVVVEASASFEASVEKNNSTVIVPEGKMDAVVIGDDGTMTLPAGTVVESVDGTITTLPAGGTLATDGTVATEGTKITENTDGTVTVTDKDGNKTTITPAEGEEVVVNPDGTMELPEGTVVEKPDGTTTTLPNGGTLAADGTVTVNGEVTVEDAEGNETTITPPADGENVTVNPDGTMELPEGTVVDKPDGSTTTLPDGGSMDAEGNVTSEGAEITEKADGSVTVTDKDGNETTITPAEGEEVVVKPDGTVEVPAGSEIETESGTATIPEDSGTVTIPADKVDEVTADENGTVTLPAGTTVTKNDETITLTEGGTIAADGTVTDPAAPPETPEVPETPENPENPENPETPENPENPEVPETPEKPEKPTPKPPYIGGYYPSYTPSVTPAAPSVDSSSLNSAALAVGSAIKDGSAEFTPVSGYTKDEVLQLQKDGKLRMGIEKAVGYGSVAEKNLADAAIKSAGGAVSGTSVMYFDITPVLKLDNGTVVAHVTDTEKAITITIELSDELTKAAKDGKDIAVVRVHDGKAEILSAKLNAAKTKVTFSSADFSTYAVVALNKTTSAKTFDAGIAMYVGMAMLAATGSAVVMGKKRK